MQPFDYLIPGDHAEASALLAAGNGRVRPFMGGTDLLIRTRGGFVRPQAVVDLKGLPGMKEIRPGDDGWLIIGAACTMNQVAMHPLVQARYDLLVQAERGAHAGAGFLGAVTQAQHPVGGMLLVGSVFGRPGGLILIGLLAALGTTITTMVIAAIGTWFGGAVDGVIQRITEVNMVLPLLPILIMVGTLYQRSIWVMLGLVILLSIFGSGIKTYRAVFLQIKESSYIEAARAYGASNWRIIFVYMVPRIIPMLIPQMVVLIPSYVFLEASLAYLGLGDPTLPTWGKIINDANVGGALNNRQYYWVLEPAILLMITGLGFTMVGYALDRIFNPRLREM